MNIVIKLLYACVDFVLLNALVSGIIPDPLAWAWYSLCIALAFALRLGMEHKRHKLTWIALLYQCIYTISWCFFMVLVWNYCFLKTTKGFEIYLFINSLFAVFFVEEFEVIVKIGFKAWLRIKLGAFLASEKKGETP